MVIEWFVLDTPGGPLLYHNGMTGGSASVMLLDPAWRRGVVILSNTAAPPEPTDLALHILAGAPRPRPTGR